MSNSEQQYLDLLKKVYEKGSDTGDRTGTGMRSLFGETMEFDLRDGFPLLTTKKMFTRGVFGELLWFLSGSTSNTELEKDYNIKFWREWQNSEGELPNIYGKHWTRWEGSKKIIKVERRIKRNNNEEVDYNINPVKEEVRKVSDYSNLIGKTFKSRKHGDFLVFDVTNEYNKEDNPKGLYKYSIQFVKTGYIKHNVKTHSIKNGTLEDPYYPSIEGVGCVGKYRNDTSDPIINKLKSTWRKMLYRCYNEKHVEFHNYGGKGIFVDNRWLNFENFVEDAQKLPNWNKKKEYWNGFNLDKDYYGSNCYSKETCVWLSISENILYTHSKPFVVYENNKELGTFLSNIECGDYIGVDHRRISDFFTKGYLPKKYAAYHFEYIEYDEDNYVYRYELPFNQIKYIIKELKNNPNSRRILYTGWNAPEMQWEDTALPCCHSTVVQFYVEDGYLDMYHYQRSGDMFLGIPVNIASYATLLTMIAQQCNLKPRIMKHTVGVAHIYHNHLEQVKLQLTREPLPLPTLNIKRKPDSIFDYKFGDFELIGYESHGGIKGDVAV